MCLPLFFRSFRVFLLEACLVEFGIEGIEIFFVELFGEQAQALAEPLIMHDLTFAQESDNVLDVVVVAEAQDIVISRPRLLLP